MTSGATVHYRLIDRCAVLTLANPPVNSLNHEMRRELASALERAASDDSAKAIVLVGAGKGFCAGGDLREFGTAAASAPPGLSSDLHPAIELSSKPVVAAIHDIAMGGGLETALACHSRVASANARIGLPEVLRGTIPLSGTQRLPRLLGVERSIEFILSGRTATAIEFTDTPLFDEIVHETDVLSAALSLANEYIDSRRLPLLVRQLAIAADNVAEIFASSRERVRESGSADCRTALSAIDAIEAAATCTEFDEGLSRARCIYDALMLSDEVTRLRDHFFETRRPN